MLCHAQIVFLATLLALPIGLGGGAPSASADVRVGVAIGVPHARLFVAAPTFYAGVPPYYTYARPYGAYVAAPVGFGFGFRPANSGWRRGPYFVRRAWR